MMRRSTRKGVSSEHLPTNDDMPRTRKKSNILRYSDEHGDSGPATPTSRKANQTVELQHPKQKKKSESPLNTTNSDLPSPPVEISRRSKRVSKRYSPEDYDLPSTKKKSKAKAELSHSDEQGDPMIVAAEAPTSAKANQPVERQLRKSKQEQKGESPKNTSKEDLPSQPTATRKSERVSKRHLPIEKDDDVPRTNKKSNVNRRGTRQSEEQEKEVYEPPTPNSAKASQTQTVKLPKSKQRKKSEDSGNTLNRKLSNVKCPLPCREEQFQDIWSFLSNNLTQKDSSCMYVAGVPGTGKTLITRSVVKALHESGADFTDIYINGLTLSTPNRIYKRFYQELTPGKEKLKLTPEKASIKLQLYFETYHKPVVLIIDELDQVLDKNQVILYRLLEWTSTPSSQFSLICIFNTMNLPENVMTMRNNSRMGMSRCTFPPYTRDQLGIIVQQYLGPEKTAKIGEAVSLLSTKVAAISGDARRAIDISKRTLELVEANGVSGALAVSQAFKELFSGPVIKALRNCSKLEKLILQTIISDLHTTGSEETSVRTVASNVLSQCTFDGWNINTDSISNAIGRLVQCRMIFLENNTCSIHNKIVLNVPIVDIQFAFGKIEE